ncbi:MAG TPA: serine hydrolase domain-containing protein [Burkholderiales bacterium]|jgi:CubicO group peptidase (beta-lactamase class C family)|nr:serine hydrolase domain-containing protein [Burkholderiales bacterium]
MSALFPNPMRPAAAFLAALALAAAALGASAAPLPEVQPEDVGLSSQRLALIDAAMQRAVDSGELPGAVVFIARGGKLAYAKSFGWQDKLNNVPMRNDSIFRLYSMTKPIVSVAAMMLVEEGRLGLQEPVSKYIPEMKDMKVGIEETDASTGIPGLRLVPARRPITVQDLMRHTSGFTYGVLGPPTAIRKMYNDAGIFSQKWVLADFVKALAKMPLMFEPGTAWEYGHSTDVLGRVIEVASGQALDRFLKERIFDPLGMVDTAFEVAPDKVGRLAQPIPDPYTGKTPELLDLTEPQTFFAGGHGLVSTAADYLRFAQMLENGGSLEGVRILGRKTVEYMTADHVNAGIDRGNAWLPGPGYGFGLGFGTRTETGQSQWPGSVGDFFWGGYAGTYFWVDPQEELVPVYLTQEPVRRTYYRLMMRNLVYQAIRD